jgi:hypothetical protein
MEYWIKVVFVDNQELIVKDTLRHNISDELDALEIESSSQVIVVPMKQIKYISCDSKIFKKRE